MKNPYQAYSKASHTVPKTKQVVMLYDAMIRNMQQARVAMEEQRIEERYNKLVKASDIIVGLQACLDFDQAEQAAQVLYEFYSSMEMRINGLHRSNDAQLCGELIEELKEMRAMWDRFDRGEGEESANHAVDESALIPVLAPQDVAAAPVTDAQDAPVVTAAGGVTFSA
jgi:flagellar protein FliS